VVVAKHIAYKRRGDMEKLALQSVSETIHEEDPKIGRDMLLAISMLAMRQFRKSFEEKSVESSK